MRPSASIVAAGVTSLWVGSVVTGSVPRDEWLRHSIPIRVGPDLQGVAIRAPEGVAVLPGDASRLGLRDRPIPIAGFAPHIAIGLTDRREYGELLLEHHLVGSVTGNALNPPMSTHYAVGVLDTGATTHLIGFCDRETLGLEKPGPYMTDLTIPIGGAGGTVEADVSWPIGVFVAGIQAIDPVSLALNTGLMRGHWQVSVAALPEETCGDDADVPSVIGTGLTAFQDIVIRNDHLRTLVRGGVTYVGPEVDVLPAGSPSTPDYPKDVILDLRPTALQTMHTTAYFPDAFNGDFETPWIPSALATQAGDLPSGGWYYASVRLEEGASGELQKEFMVDTGAQVSLIRVFIAGQLGLDLENPEFEVEVLGADGSIQLVPGFYLDTFKIDASGGPMVFHNVPVIVLNVTSIEGGTLDGIVGMNVLYDRNLVLMDDPYMGPVLEISNPVVNPVPGDFDGDADLDLDDFAWFAECLQGPGVQPDPYFPCVNAFDFNADGDVDLADFAAFQQEWG